MKITETNAEQGLDVAVPKKRIYQPPALKFYGSVTTLTTSGPNSGPEYFPMSQYSTMRGTAGSDRGIKRHIVRIGAHPLGIGLYLFDYKPAYRDAWGHDHQFGVMADEVEKVMPEAVSVHPDGYKMVNYAMLGISRNLH